MAMIMEVLYGKRARNNEEHVQAWLGDDGLSLWELHFVTQVARVIS